MATKKTTIRQFINERLKGRPQPFVPKAGVKKARYSEGGKVARKKNV